MNKWRIWHSPFLKSDNENANETHLLVMTDSLYLMYSPDCLSVHVGDFALLHFSLMCLATIVTAWRWSVEEKTNPEIPLKMACLVLSH